MAVYTHIGDTRLREFIASYNIGALVSFKGIASGVENSNYYVETTDDAFILTLYEKRVRKTDLPYFLGLMSHLANAGYPCPEVIQAINGSNVQTLEKRPAALISFLRGAEAHSISAQHCFEVGRALAQLHQLARDFRPTRSNDLSLHGWHQLQNTSKHRVSAAFPGLSDIVDQELSRLDKSWPQHLPTGAIHADLFPDNVFFENEKLVGVIDFYFACTDFLAYDLAITVNAWCFDQDHRFINTYYEALIRGYEGVRSLEAEEKQALPILLRGAATRFLLTRAHDWVFPQPNAVVTAKNPMDYEKRLRHWQHWSIA